MRRDTAETLRKTADYLLDRVKAGEAHNRDMMRQVQLRDEQLEVCRKEIARLTSENEHMERMLAAANPKGGA